MIRHNLSQKGRAAFLSLIMITSVMATGVAFTGSAAADAPPGSPTDSPGTLQVSVLNASTGTVNVTFGVNTTSETINKTNTTASDVAVGSVNSDLDNTAKAIQFAVDNATAENTTVRVGPGTYNGSVSVTNNLTLEGPNAGIAGDSGIRGAEATINGGLRIGSGSNAEDNEVSEAVIDGVEINGTSSGINAGNVRVGTQAIVGNVTIRNSVINTTAGPTGANIEAQEVTNLDINDNTFGKNSGGVLVAVNLPETTVKSLEIENNTLVGVDRLFNNVGFKNGRGITSTTVEIVDNDVSGAGTAIGVGGVSPDVSTNPNYTISGNKIDASDTGIVLNDGTVNSFSVKNNAFSDSDVHVDDSTGSVDLDAILNDQGNTFDRAVTVKDSSGNITSNRIRSSIQPAADAASSDQTVSVGPGTYNESVTIGTDNVTLASTDGATATTINASSGSTTVQVSADKISVDGFTLNGSVDNDVIESKSTGGVLNVTDNSISINTNTGNTPDGKSPYAVDSDFRINVVDNTISGDDSSTAYGLTTRGGAASDDSEIRDNDVSGVVTGLQTRGASGVAVTGNTFTDISASAVFATTANAEMTAYNISNNDISDVGNAVDLNANSNDISGVEVNNNKFANADQLNGFGAVEARENGGSITETVDATSNWWGASGGPSGQGPGSGGAVSANVEFKPFYVDAARQTLRVDVNDQFVKNASRADVSGDGSATITVSGSDVRSTTVTLPSGTSANSVTVGEASEPTGNAQGSEPDTDVATYLDVSADQEVDDSVDISVTVKLSILSDAGIATENATILHYVDGTWTELETTSSTSGGTVTLTATASTLSPFAVGAAKAEPAGSGSGGSGSVNGALVVGDTSVTERLSMGPVQEVTVRFEEATTGSVQIQAVDGFPASAPLSEKQVFSTIEIAPPEEAANAPGSVEVTISQAAVSDAGAEPSELQLVRYNENSGEIETLSTDIVSADEQSVVLSAETPGFSVFGVVISEQMTATTTPAATTTPEPTETPSQTETAVPTDTPAGEPTATEQMTETQPPTEGGGPGFGVSIAVIALITAALLAVRSDT